MQLVTSEGRLISIWTLEQYMLVKKYAEPPRYVSAADPFALSPGELLTFGSAAFVSHLKSANSGFAVMLDTATITTADKVQIYQAGLLVMILLDKLERACFLPDQKLVWKIEELPRHATC